MPVQVQNSNQVFEAAAEPGGASPPPDFFRITEESDFRITEAGDFREIDH